MEMSWPIRGVGQRQNQPFLHHHEKVASLIISVPSSFMLKLTCDTTGASFTADKLTCKSCWTIEVPSDTLNPRFNTPLKLSGGVKLHVPLPLLTKKTVFLRSLTS